MVAADMLFVNNVEYSSILVCNTAKIKVIETISI